MYTMGLDIGSTASKGVIVRDGESIAAVATIDSGTGTSGPKRVVDELFEKLSITRKDINTIIVTGYGRMNYPDSDKQISEISCHAKGVNFLVPSARTIIDIGGQDAKALKLNDFGKLNNFVMNDKCAAGTGRFLDVIAKVLEVDVSDLGVLSSKSEDEISISSTCTVFAESEVISHLSNNVPLEDIISGVHHSIAKRVSALVKRVGVNDEVVMVGGVARNCGVVMAMGKYVGKDIIVPDYPQLTGALGAALYAFEESQKNNQSEQAS